ncbi:MAG: hypothetical protein R3F02_06265 [Thiolinea sp.]
MEIRDRGKLSLLVRDRRVERLVAYYPENEVLDQAEIRSELAAYGRAKVKIMAKVHELEKRVVWGLGAVESRTDEEKRAGKKYFGAARHGDYLYKLYSHVADEASDKSADFTKQHFQSVLNIVMRFLAISILMQRISGALLSWCRVIRFRRIRLCTVR